MTVSSLKTVQFIFYSIILWISKQCCANETSSICFDHGKHPFMVFILQRREELEKRYIKVGSGVLITLQWVLTARSRLSILESVFPLAEVHAGSFREVDAKFGQTRRVAQIREFENSYRYQNDIALMKLDAPFRLRGKIAVAKLPPTRTYWDTCSNRRIYGYNIWTNLRNRIFCADVIRCSKKLSFEYICVNMKENLIDNLLAAAGSAVICDDDVIVGIVAVEVDNPGYEVTYVGAYMEWIKNITGIEVPYLSSPPVSGSEKVFHSIILSFLHLSVILNNV